MTRIPAYYAETMVWNDRAKVHCCQSETGLTPHEAVSKLRDKTGHIYVFGAELYDYGVIIDMEDTIACLKGAEEAYAFIEKGEMA